MGSLPGGTRPSVPSGDVAAPTHASPYGYPPQHLDNYRVYGTAASTAHNGAQAEGDYGDYASQYHQYWSNYSGLPPAMATYYRQRGAPSSMYPPAVQQMASSYNYPGSTALDPESSYRSPWHEAPYAPGYAPTGYGYDYAAPNTPRPRATAKQTTHEGCASLLSVSSTQAHSRPATAWATCT